MHVHIHLNNKSNNNFLLLLKMRFRPALSAWNHNTQYFFFQKLFERGIPLATISLGFIFFCGALVFLSTIILYPSREILQAELDATQYCKLKPTGLNKKLIDHEKIGKNDFPLEQFEAGLPDDSCKYENNKWTESPLASGYLFLS